MHGVFARESIGPAGEGQFRASFPPAPSAPAIEPIVAVRPGHYGEQRKPNFAAIGTVLALHAIVLVGLVKADVIPLARKAPPPLVVDLLAEPPTPPPPPADPQPEVQPVKPLQPVVVSPPPVVTTPAPPPPVAVAAEAPPPPQAVVVAPAAKAAAVSAPVSVDLSTKLVSGKPPRYPIESRRKREEGTVVLWVTLGVDGSVADIGVKQSSGHDRLDRAALDAVRRWRWSPTLVGGQAVQVRGILPFPFILN